MSELTNDQVGAWEPVIDEWIRAGRRMALEVLDNTISAHDGGRPITMELPDGYAVCRRVAANPVPVVPLQILLNWSDNIHVLNPIVQQAFADVRQWLATQSE